MIGLTTNRQPTITNDFRFNYTRNFWQWGSARRYPAARRDWAARSRSAAKATQRLIPYNVNSQNVRQRFWDGQDKMIKDDLTWIKGNHLIQFGGLYQRNYDFHMRTDNGQGINNPIVYQSHLVQHELRGFAYPSAPCRTNQQTNFNTYYSYVLGFVSQSQVVYTRSGSNLKLGPSATSASDQSIIPSYNLYVIRHLALETDGDSDLRDQLRAGDAAL